MLNYIYLLKVVLCSAVLLVYYFIALRNKVYHQYNRFYLHLSVVLAWTIPLLNFNFFITQNQVAAPIYNVIHFTTQHKNEATLTIVNAESAHLTFTNVTLVLFTLVSLYFFSSLLVSFYKIYKLKQTYQPYTIGEYTIYLTNEKYTPYSFMNLIFWNRKIDLDSKLGKQILQHELVHIQEKHSIDKICLQLNLIIGWFNPFFWIIKNELGMIHEFIADKKSIPNADASEFASMILSIAEVNKNIILTNPFFFSPIKRRLKMLCQKKSVKYSYLQKLLVLPLLAGLIILLSFKTKQMFILDKQENSGSTIIKNTLATESSNLVVSKQINKVAEVNAVKKNIAKQLQDTVVQNIDELHNEYLALEKRYKIDAAIASERKKLMLLIQEQNLSDDEMLYLFKAIIDIDDASSLATKNQKEKKLKIEYEKILGSGNFNKFWRARKQLRDEMDLYLNK